MITLPIYYNEINDMLYSIGVIDDRDMDDEQIDKIYYDSVASIIIDTVKRYK